MKTILRLNESELKDMVSEIAQKLITEMDERAVLNAVAASLSSMGSIEAMDGENDVTIQLPSGEEVMVFYDVYDMSMNVRREAPDKDDIMEDYEIVVDAISIDGEVELQDVDGIIKTALENVVEVTHDIDPYDDYYDEE